MKNNNPLKDLHRLLDKQNFKNENELKKFMNSIVLKPIPEISDEELTKEERAQDLVEEAYDLPIRAAIKNIDIALNFNPDCIEAYEFLGSVQRSIESALPYYEKGVNIGKRLFGGNYLEKHRGQFWGFHETRPFMRCMSDYSDCLYKLGKKSESISVKEEMILLNPNDNQGVRDQLMLYLIELNEFEKFKTYCKLFPGDFGAYAYFNRTLYSFKTEGENEKSYKLLKKAIEENKFVLPMIISSKIQTEYPNTYGIGSKEEAKYYSVFAQKIWQQTPGAVKWLMKFRHSI
ncbi:MAG: hypothetical protein M3R36_09130 [Bacteroidota bacterium]|nr:hypothetical protein [Bacteroidota bacterium]